MEIACMLICTMSCVLCVYLVLREHKKVTNVKPDFTDDEISKIRQVVNILSWGGEDENQN